MTGIFSIKTPQISPREHYEAIDFIENTGLLTQLYFMLSDLKTGQKIEIICELEE